MTAPLDPTASIAPLEAKIRRTADPVHREMLYAFRERLLGELVGDLERAFAPLAPTFTLVNRTAGAHETHVDAAAVRAGAEAAVAGGLRLWGEWEQIVVDDDGLVAHGVLVTLMPATRAGVALAPDQDPGTLAMVRSRAVVTLEFDEGRIAREVFYSDNATAEVTTLAPGGAPDHASLAEAVASRTTPVAAGGVP